MDQYILRRLTLEDRDFVRLKSFVETELGIKMPPEKRVMLESRLQKRVKQLRMESFAEYCEYVFSPEGTDRELVNLIDSVTTNKTDFFREPNHFSFITDVLFPDLFARTNGRIHSPFTVWSSACSTGEEPYTLAMILDSMRVKYGDFEYKILGTDISTRVLKVARMAIYPESRIEPIPQEFRKRYLLRSKDRTNAQVRISPELRAHVTFGRLNLMSSSFGLRKQFDLIFCRNVLIYFNKSTQETLLRKLHAQLKEDGHLFLGHSETLTGLSFQLEPVASTVYRKSVGRGVI